MQCVICKNVETQNGLVTVTLQRGESTIIFKEVPAEVCQNCGEYYLSENISEKLLEKAELVAQSGAEVEIHKFAT